MINALSIVLPAKNEASGLSVTLPEIRRLHPEAEIIVVDDGSDDETASIAGSVKDVIVVKHPVSIGNGGAVKSGARAASGDVIVFMDADGQHKPQDISRLLALINQGFDLVVGARGRESQASWGRSIANKTFNTLASWMTGFEIQDLTSGFRAVRRDKFLSILYLLPNKFSYPTTSTMAFFKSGYFVGYVPIKALKREGKSHIRVFHDGIRFLIIILKIGTLFSPMRLFLPISVLIFYTATLYYLYTFSSSGRFTNMGVLLYIASLLVFLMGILSEQISSLHYRGTGKPTDRKSLTEKQP
ncbi:MAG: glycosyltransferase family 2 protein [Granulosicoccus sp.]